MARPLFTDGWNSFWHFFFGFIALKYEWIIPVFILYQLYDYYDKNILVDIAEFFVGYFFSFIFLLLNKI